MSCIKGRYFTGPAAIARRNEIRAEAIATAPPQGPTNTAPKGSDLAERLGSEGYYLLSDRRWAHDSKAHYGDPKHQRGGVREVKFI